MTLMTFTEKWKNYLNSLFNTKESGSFYLHDGEKKDGEFIDTSVYSNYIEQMTVDPDYLEQMKAISNIEKLKGLANHFKECEENG